jgi:hypothetical protein
LTAAPVGTLTRRQEVKRISGVESRDETTGEVETTTVTTVPPFTTGTMVQVLLLDRRVPADIERGSGRSKS